MTSFTSLGAYLRAARRRAGLTQRQVAEACGISRAAISQFEHDVVLPSLRVLGVLLDILPLDVAVLRRVLRRLPEG